MEVDSDQHTYKLEDGTVVSTVNRVVSGKLSLYFIMLA